MKIKKIGPRAGVSSKFYNVDPPLITNNATFAFKQLQ